MPYAVNQGVRIHYQIEGDGQPLVLQHGFTDNLRDLVRPRICGSAEAVFKRIERHRGELLELCVMASGVTR